ncbi:unnamed protein product [Echinostoma caproni]|uniref:Exportin-4 n=1 Tax=Echinostoma caproni TaxID=27848 RepID=A0A3P8HB11_9TREM|nr:unnamed protein product [Echinostoma caproni]
MLYEAGRCLSHAVVREWNTVFAESVDNLDDSKAVQLLQFILDWANRRSKEVSSAARQRILGAVGALIKRAAAAHAEKVASAWRSSFTLSRSGDSGRLGQSGPRILTHPPDDPGPPCPILVRLIDHVEALIQLAMSETDGISNEKSALDQSLLGLCILSALLDEMSNAEDSVQLDLPLEAHIFLRARFQLHTWIRSSDVLGTRTLSCLTRISSMTGPLTDPVTPLTGLNEPDSNGTPSAEDTHQPPSLACLFHVLTFMNHLSLWLMTGPDELTSANSVLMALSSTQQAVLREDCDRRLTDAQSVPRICPAELHAYELPLLSELVQNLVLYSSRTWEPVETALALPGSVAAGRRSASDVSTIYHHALLVLIVLDRFFVRISALLMQCLNFAAKWSSDSDGDGKLAHEAVERLFSNWIDLVDFNPAAGPDSALENGENWNKKSRLFSTTCSVPLTVGDSHDLERRSQQVAQMVLLVHSNAAQHQTSLFQAFLISKLVAGVGLREPWADQQDEDIDLDLDDNDLSAWEDSLFAAGACGLANPKQSCDLLLRLIDERVDRLVRLHNQAPDQGTVDLYEDLHWLLLVTGHFLVSGPALMNSLMRPGCSWGTEFSVRCAHLSVFERSV